jgi:hypothetical protein
MSESFFQRWSRRKTEHTQELNAFKPPLASQEVNQTILHSEVPRNAERNPVSDEAGPTMEDVVNLDNDSDYSPFVKRDVDQAVRRAALKKMFSDPHFNVMDGLDIYISDYTKPSPLTPAMLAALKHTANIFGPVPTSEKSDEEREDNGQSTLNGGDAGLSDDPAGQELQTSNDEAEQPYEGIQAGANFSSDQVNCASEEDEEAAKASLTKHDNPFQNMQLQPQYRA